MDFVCCADLHLERLAVPARLAFFEKLRREDFDAALVTGDISEAGTLALHLGELAGACSPRNVYFVLGNHDFYGSCFDEVDPGRPARHCEPVGRANKTARREDRSLRGSDAQSECPAARCRAGSEHPATFARAFRAEDLRSVRSAAQFCEYPGPWNRLPR